MKLAELPPLSLYVHIPWCLRKCPYCDFNSHEKREEVPEEQYVDAVVADLESALPNVWGRRLHTIFIGGGTPSLFTPQAIDRLLTAVRTRITSVVNRDSRNDRQRRETGVSSGERADHRQRDHRADHHDLAVRKIDELHDAIHHRVAERYDGVDAAQRKPVHHLLQKHIHGSSLAVAAVRTNENSTRRCRFQFTRVHRRSYFCAVAPFMKSSKAID